MDSESTPKNNPKVEEINLDNVFTEQTEATSENQSQLTESADQSSIQENDIKSVNDFEILPVIIPSLLVGLFLISIFTWLIIYRDHKDLMDIESKLDSYDMKITNIEKSTYYNRLSLIYSRGIVTDKLIVTRVIFTDNNIDPREIDIDFGLQPDFVKYSKGNGKFDLDSKTLQKALEDLINKFEGYYDKSSARANLLAFKEFKVNLSYNNYPVAVYQNNILTLVNQ